MPHIGLLLQTTQTQCQLLFDIFLTMIKLVALPILALKLRSEDAMEVKSNVEAAKRLVAHIKQTNLQSRLTKTLKQTISTCFYTYREMIGSVIEAWEVLDCLLDARNELKYLEDINKLNTPYSNVARS